MIEVTAADVRAFALERVSDQLLAMGLTPADVPDDFDLLDTGTIDSLGFLELVGALADRFGVDVDFEEMDPEDIGLVGPLCRLVVLQAGAEVSS
jgi:acyl carrier protein